MLISIHMWEVKKASVSDHREFFMMNLTWALGTELAHVNDKLRPPASRAQNLGQTDFWNDEDTQDQAAAFADPYVRRGPRSHGLS
jgi:hypothetical protein